MNGFASKIKNIEANINRLKTIGLRSASTIGVTEKNISLANGHTNALITLTNQDGLPMLFSAYLVSPTNFSDREVTLRPATNRNGKNQIRIKAWSLDGFVILISATSAFTASIEYDLGD
jgi:hypothetical protein